MSKVTLKLKEVMDAHIPLQEISKISNKKFGEDLKIKIALIRRAIKPFVEETAKNIDDLRNKYGKEVFQESPDATDKDGKPIKNSIGYQFSSTEDRIEFTRENEAILNTEIEILIPSLRISSLLKVPEISSDHVFQAFPFFENDFDDDGELNKVQKQPTKKNDKK